jgi:hypothetical protein
MLGFVLEYPRKLRLCEESGSMNSFYITLSFSGVGVDGIQLLKIFNGDKAAEYVRLILFQIILCELKIILKFICCIYKFS